MLSFKTRNILIHRIESIQKTMATHIDELDKNELAFFEQLIDQVDRWSVPKYTLSDLFSLKQDTFQHYSTLRNPLRVCDEFAFRCWQNETRHRDQSWISVGYQFDVKPICRNADTLSIRHPDLSLHMPHLILSAHQQPGTPRMYDIIVNIDD